jgi:hypothetical protein
MVVTQYLALSPQQAVAVVVFLIQQVKLVDQAVAVAVAV